MLSKNKLKYLKKFQQKKTRKEERKFLVEGPKLVAEALKANWKILELFYTKEYDVPAALSSTAQQLVTDKELQSFSNFTTSNQVAALVEIKNEVNSNWKSGISLVLNGISDPGNLGTIIRTATWFGIDRIICDNTCVEIFNPKVVQSTMGALFSCDISTRGIRELVNEAKDSDLPIVLADLNGEHPSTIKQLKSGLIIMGSESHGISDQIKTLATKTISIPKAEGSATESLNVSIATSIICYELKRDRP